MRFYAQVCAGYKEKIHFPLSTLRGLLERFWRVMAVGWPSAWAVRGCVFITIIVCL